MIYKTHIITSLTVSAAISYYTGLHNHADLPFYVGVVIGSLLPDVDQPSSKAGKATSIEVRVGEQKKTIGLSPLIKRTFGHRGATHSLLFNMIFFLLFLMIPYTFLLGLAIGYFLHIMGDMFSVRGVPLFYPFIKKKFSFHLYKTGKNSEKVIYYLSLIIFSYLLYKNSTPLTLIELE